MAVYVALAMSEKYRFASSVFSRKLPSLRTVSLGCL